MLQKSTASFTHYLCISLCLWSHCVWIFGRGGLGGVGAFICPSGAFMSTFKFGKKSWVGKKDRRAMKTAYIWNDTIAATMYFIQYDTTGSIKQYNVAKIYCIILQPIISVFSFAPLHSIFGFSLKWPKGLQNNFQSWGHWLFEKIMQFM